MSELEDCFLDNFNEEEKCTLLSLMKKCTLPQGTVLTEESQYTDRLFVLIDGEVNASKGHKPASDTLYSSIQFDEPLDFKKSSDQLIIGVLEYFSRHEAEQTITLTTDAFLYEITFDQIEQLEKDQPELYHKVIYILGAYTAKSHRKTNNLLTYQLSVKLTMLRKRDYFANFILKLLIFFSGLLFLFDYMAELYKGHGWVHQTLASGLWTLLLISVLFITKNTPPASFFGLTWQGGGKSFLESIPVSVGVIAILILIKFLSITLLHLNDPLFSLSYKHLSLANAFYAAFLYALFCFPQELVARGMLQGSFQELQTSIKKSRIWVPILASNIIFGSFHAIIFSINTAIIVTLVGIPWGWLYARHKTLVGPTFSHIVIGLFGFYILGTFS